MSRQLRVFSTLILAASALIIQSGCSKDTIYADVYSPKRNYFKAPVEKPTTIEMPTETAPRTTTTAPTPTLPTVPDAAPPPPAVPDATQPAPPLPGAEAAAPMAM